MKKSNIVFALLILCLIILGTVFSYSDYAYIQRDGILFIDRYDECQRFIKPLKDDKEFLRTIEPFDDVVEFQFDWADPEGNIGKEIFNDGECSIEITNVRDDKNGGYDIFFRARGTYNHKAARLITACSYADNQLSNSGKLLTSIGNDTYINKFPIAMGCSVYKDGDVFGFNIFPLECYDNGQLQVIDQIEANENTVTMKLTDIYEITWQLNKK